MSDTGKTFELVLVGRVSERDANDDRLWADQPIRARLVVGSDSLQVVPDGNATRDDIRLRHVWPVPTGMRRERVEAIVREYIELRNEAARIGRRLAEIEWLGADLTDVSPSLVAMYGSDQELATRVYEVERSQGHISEELGPEPTA